MEPKFHSQQVNTTFFYFFLFLILFTSHFTFATQVGSWVGSKYNIQCTMCAACDNPCNQHPPPSPSLSLPPPPPPSTSGDGGGYNYSPPPPTSETGGGGYYYSPPPPVQTGIGGGGGGGYYYAPPVYGTYPTPKPPNPIMNSFPYYYHNSPEYDSATMVSFSGGTIAIVVITIFGFLFVF